MPKFAANLTMMFTELPFLDRFAAAAAAGFDAVEFLFPYDFDKQRLAGLLKDHGLTLVLHNLPAGDWAAGERGIACHPDRVAEFRAGVDRAIDYAKALACPKVNCLAGILPAGVTAETRPRDARRQSALRRRQAGSRRDSASCSSRSTAATFRAFLSTARRPRSRSSRPSARKTSSCNTTSITPR